jgi:flagellar biosynthesis protein FliP
MDELGASPTMSLWLVVLAVPLLLTVATAFTKATVVLGALRVGLGAEALLPAAATLGVALVVTGIVMTPIALEIVEQAEARGGLEALVGAGPRAWWASFDPWVAFCTRHASPDELQFFADLQGRPISDALVIVPAFLVTELTEALAMAVVVLVPLLLVDLVVAQVLVLLGLVNQPPAPLTVPLKLLLFLSVGGWDVILGGLVEGYR